MATPLAIQIPPKSSSDDGGSRSHEVRWHPDDPHQPVPGVLDGRAWDEWSKKERPPICHGDRCSNSDLLSGCSGERRQSNQRATEERIVVIPKETAP